MLKWLLRHMTLLQSVLKRCAVLICTVLRFALLAPRPVSVSPA